LKKRWRAQSNCGVLIAGNCTSESRTGLSARISSDWSEAEKPLIACFAAQ